MKKNYMNAEVLICKFDKEDVLTLSVASWNEGQEDSNSYDLLFT